MDNFSRKIGILSILLLISIIPIYYNFVLMNYNREVDLEDIAAERNTPVLSAERCWVRTWGLGYFGRSIAVDSEDNIYTAGDALVKYNKYGIKQWDVDYDDINDPYIYDVAVDSLDNIYIVGFNNDNITIIKHNSTGGMEWTKTWGGSNTDSGYAIAIDKSTNDIYIAGRTLSFPKNGTSDVCVIKYDSSGAFQWNKTWGWVNWEYAYDIAVDPSSSDIYLTGQINKGSDRDLFLLKYNQTGDLKWVRLWDGYGDYDSGYGVCVDNAGNIIVTGYTYVTALNYDLVLIKYNSTNAMIWNKTWGISTGTANEEGLGVVVDSYNNIYATGTQSAYFPYGMMLVKYSSSGTYQWVEDYGEGGGLVCSGEGVAVDSDNNIIVGGTQEVDVGDYYMMTVKYAYQKCKSLGYKIEFEVGDTLIYEITEFDETEIDNLGLDIGSNAKKGAKRCYEITSISEKSSYWEISYDAWDWTENEDDFVNLPSTDDSIKVYENPQDYGENVLYLHPDLMDIITTPTEEYLLNVDWDSRATISGLTVTCDLITHEIIYIYDDSGFLKEYKVTNGASTILAVEYAGERSGERIPDILSFLLSPIGLILIGCIVGGIIGAIIVIKKRSSKGLEYGKYDVKEDDIKFTERVVQRAIVNKCPDCGWVLSSRTAKCPSCGSKLDHTALPKTLQEKNIAIGKINEEFEKINKELKEIDYKFETKQISSSKYLELKNKLNEKIGELRRKLSLIDE